MEIPPYHALLWPAVLALRELGGSGTIDELTDKVVEMGDFTDDQLEVLHQDGPRTEIEYRLAWARTYLKGMGLAINSTRGVWNLTEHGQRVEESELPDLRQRYLQRNRNQRPPRGAAVIDEPMDAVEPTWEEQLLDCLMRLTPSGFERLTQRLLREAGFTSTQVLGRTGDGGIDGVGVYRMSLISFQVFFQCKRYVGSVGASAVRDFRGAMTGRGDKGLLITTGSFTKDAKEESARDGAPPIDLIDGTRLCALLRQFEMGVTVRKRIEEDVTVHPEFFAAEFA